MVIDTDARVVVANEAAAELFGVPLDELMDRPLSAIPLDLLDERGHLLAAERLPLMRALAGEEVSDEVVRFVRRDGSLLWVEVHANPLHHDDGVLYGAVASYDDVTQRVEQDRRTRYEADTDALTGLANRRALERTLAAALTRAGARSRSVGAADARPRRLQGDQRHARARGGRRGAARGRARGCGAACASATSWRGSAATSSWSCSPTSAAARARCRTRSSASARRWRSRSRSTARSSGWARRSASRRSRPTAATRADLLAHADRGDVRRQGRAQRHASIASSRSTPSS